MIILDPSVEARLAKNPMNSLPDATVVYVPRQILAHKVLPGPARMPRLPIELTIRW